MATSLLATQAVRLLRIEKRLLAGGVSMNGLCALLDASAATVKRDLAVLREELGAPILYDRFDDVYRLVAPWEGLLAHLLKQAQGATVADFFSAPLTTSGNASPTVDAVDGNAASTAPRQLEGA